MYFFQSSPGSYKRFIKRFPTENSLIKLYAKTCVDFDIESKPKKRRCPHCGSCQNGPFRKNNEKLRLCKRCGRTFSIFRNSIFDKSKADFRIWMYIGYCMFYYHHVYFNVDKISRTQIIRETHAPSNATIYHIYDVLYKLFKSQNKVDMLLIFNIFLPFMKIFHNMNPYRKKEH